ncbi:hypothetical protein FACS1894218_2370 [Bacilli bacterium]|nr:hypothetical protein FACS1894218_2370 [Bacilli bacterium]
MEIPLIATNVTNIINSYLNDRFHFTFELNDIKASINSVYADTDSVKELLSSDQFIASAMLQDPRFMIPDARAPNIHGIVSVQVNGSPYSVVVPLNFGRVVALAAYPTSSDLKNVFQELDLRSAYTANNAPSVYDDVSYHNGAPLDDLLGPFGSPLNLGSDFSRAINSYDLPAASSSNNHDSFTFANNIEHNSIVISDIVKSSLAGLSFDNYVSTITVGEDTDYYGIGLGQYFVCVGI